MKNIVLYCKSYANDFNRVKKLIESIEKYNKDNIPFYLSVPNLDINLFKSLNIKNLIPDEAIYQIPKLFKDGWKNQQIIKANFWRLNLCKNYVCLDSDSEFITDFYIADFIYKDDIPYTIIGEQKDLFQWSVSNKQNLGFDPKTGFIKERMQIMKVFGNESRKIIYDFGPSPTIWNCENWLTLNKTFEVMHNIKFHGLIYQVPSEFTWYGEWLLYNKTIPIFPREPLFKVFHYEKQYVDYMKEHSVADIRENYLGMVLQSNWKR